MRIKKYILILSFFFWTGLILSQTNVPVKDSVFIADSISNRKVYDIVDVMPEFPGGNDSLMKFLLNNLRWPNEADCIGSVYISFIVAPDGNITNKKILKGICEPFDNEALRVINLMPRWNAGKLNGIAVPVRFVIPIKFSLK